MCMNWRRGAVVLLLLAAGVSGCRKAEVVPVREADDNTTHLGNSTEIVLADWLTWDRKKLYDEAHATLDTVIAQQRAVRETSDSGALLPTLRPPIGMPVLGETKFGADAEGSRPTYLKAKFDPDLALHLARFGDRQAALRFADPDDKKLLEQIDASQPERDYPVEWTQLVSLRLQLAQIKLAHGEGTAPIEGATELVLLHKQLVALLDNKAANGPLGAALLPIGRGALTEAVTAWRDGTQKKPAVADDIEAALRDWGQAPAALPPLGPGARGEALARLMGSEVRGRTVVAQTPAAVRRSLDLLALPVVQESVQTVAAFLDADGKLVEFLVAYKEGTSRTFPEPKDLARHLVDLGYATGEATKEYRLPRQSFSGGGLTFDVTTTPRSSALGAFIRIGAEKAPAAIALTHDPRDFGALSLDRSFERNRTGLVPGANPEKDLVINQPADLKRVTLPVEEPRPSAVIVQRTGDFDLVDSVTFQWSPESSLNLVAVPQLVVPLWRVYGPARIEAVDNTDRGHLLFVWENERTRLALRLPYDTAQGPELKAADRRGEAAVKERLAEVARFDKTERAQRWTHAWDEDDLQVRLPRVLPGAVVEHVRLGQPKAEVEKLFKAVPDSGLKPKAAMDDGCLNLLLASNPAAGVTFWPRQIFVRFDTDDKVAEVRVRYEGTQTPPGKDRPGLLDVLRKSGGWPEKLAPTWPGVWADIGGGQVTSGRWLDDQTSITFQRDSVTTEVTLRDCPENAPFGREMPPLSFCSRGVPGCELGDKRTEVLKHWKVDKPTYVGDALLLQPADGLYDYLLVYFEGRGEDRVIKIQAQYRNRLPTTDAAPAITDAWRDDIYNLGAIRRQDLPREPVLHSFNWHDDRTRVRIFGQQTDTGPRLYREWCELPIATPKTAKR
jgi:hypothetical protein